MPSHRRLIMVASQVEVGPAMLQTPRAVAPPDRAGDANSIVLLADPLPTGGGSFWFQRQRVKGGKQW